MRKEIASDSIPMCFASNAEQSTKNDPANPNSLFPSEFLCFLCTVDVQFQQTTSPSVCITSYIKYFNQQNFIFITKQYLILIFATSLSLGGHRQAKIIHHIQQTAYIIYSIRHIQHKAYTLYIYRQNSSSSITSRVRKFGRLLLRIKLAFPLFF